MSSSPWSFRLLVRWKMEDSGVHRHTHKHIFRVSRWWNGSTIIIIPACQSSHRTHKSRPWKKTPPEKKPGRGTNPPRFLPFFHHLSRSLLRQLRGDRRVRRCDTDSWKMSALSVALCPERVTTCSKVCSLYSEHTHTHIQQRGPLSKHTQTNTHLVSSFQNRISTATKRKIHWQWSLQFLFTPKFKKKKKKKNKGGPQGAGRKIIPGNCSLEEQKRQFKLCFFLGGGVYFHRKRAMNPKIVHLSGSNAR